MTIQTNPDLTQVRRAADNAVRTAVLMDQRDERDRQTGPDNGQDNPPPARHAERVCQDLIETVIRAANRNGIDPTGPHPARLDRQYILTQALMQASAQAHLELGGSKPTVSLEMTPEEALQHAPGLETALHHAVMKDRMDDELEHAIMDHMNTVALRALARLPDHQYDATGGRLQEHRPPAGGGRGLPSGNPGLDLPGGGNRPNQTQGRRKRPPSPGGRPK